MRFLRTTLVAVIGGIVVAGCAGATLEPTDIGPGGATLRAIGSCDGGDCHVWFRYREAGKPGTVRTTAVQGPIKSKISRVEFPTTISGLKPNTEYEYQLCGYGDGTPKSKAACVGPEGDPSKDTWERFATDGADESSDAIDGEAVDDARADFDAVDESDSSENLPETVTAAQSLALDGAGATSRSTTVRRCSARQSKTEHRGVVKFWVCATRNYSSNRVSVTAYASQYPSATSMHWHQQSIRIFRSGAKSPGRTGSCPRGGTIVRSLGRHSLGQFHITELRTNNCSMNNVPLSSRGGYRVEGKVCYDVKHDGKSSRCIVANAYV